MSDHRDYAWSGLCPSGQHGLDYRGQVCDLCPSTFTVWRKDGSDADARTSLAPSASTTSATAGQTRKKNKKEQA